MIRLSRMPAPTIKAALLVVCCLRGSGAGTRGNRPVLAPTTSVVSPAISLALRLDLKSSSAKLGEESRLPSGDFKLSSDASLICLRSTAPEEPNVYSPKRHETNKAPLGARWLAPK